MATKASWTDSLWRWSETLDSPLRELMVEAVRANASFASFLAWSMLRDEAATAVLIEEALESVVAYASRCLVAPTQRKITMRLRSQIRRIARRAQRHLDRQKPIGSMNDIEMIAPSLTYDPTDALLLRQVLDLLSPRAREVAEWIRLGYSWREIGRSFQVDASTVRQSFRRETDAALRKLGKGIRIGR